MDGDWTELQVLVRGARDLAALLELLRFWRAGGELAGAGSSGLPSGPPG